MDSVNTSALLWTRTHTRLTAIFPGLPGWAGTWIVKPIWILMKQDTVSGSGLSWAICKSAPRSRQITSPAPHHSVFYSLDALPAAQLTATEHCENFSNLADIGSILCKCASFLFSRGFCCSRFTAACSCLNNYSNKGDRFYYYGLS